MLSRPRSLLVAVCGAGLAFGFLAPYLALAGWRPALWGGAAAIMLAFLLRDIARSLPRRDYGLDIVAALSMAVAIAFGETLAAAVVSLMYAGGQLLEDVAETRARADLRALLGRVPAKALRYEDGGLAETAIEALRPGDRILIRQGDILPVDGRVLGGPALLDQSILTGESVPVRRLAGEEVLSGAQSLDMAFDMEATRTAADSTYSAIVRLVRMAQAAKAPMVRLADRFALWFLLATVLMAAAAWLLSGERMRFLAVLVAATPCPLILAVPVAIVSGIGKASRRGVLVKGGAVLETLARAATLVIDKTGTLTEGHARVVDIQVAGRRNRDEVLRLAASLDQASSHAIAASIVAAARARGLRLSLPAEASEEAGAGIAGLVDGHRVIVGGSGFVNRRLKRPGRRNVAPAGTVVVAVAIDGRPAGRLLLADRLREDAGAALDRLRRAGIGRIVLASGDRRAVVEKIAGELGLADARAELEPRDKVDVVRAERRRGVVLMAGDGVNDAPALAAADVGIAIGVRGAPAAAEAADAVLLIDNLKRIAEAVEIARRSRRIALESVCAGLGLSFAAMLAGAFGYLLPVEGALVQEAIDVAVILNALRALR
jgi:heavy metal translocating P-type ATPase